MKTLLPYIACLVLGCNSPDKQATEIIKPHVLKKDFYPSGEIKEILSFDISGKKDSISTFFNETGAIDSTVNFINNKRDGIKSTFYSIVTYKELYKNDILISHSEYDTSGILSFKTPLDITSISRTQYKFRSGRNYFDQSKKDTIELITEGLPYNNRGMEITGAVFSRINNNEFGIWKTKASQPIKNVMIIIKIYQDPGNPKETPIRFDTLFIPSR